MKSSESSCCTCSVASVDGYDSQQLRALAAIADAGSLDGAATALALTPSAVSQRLRALERACGQVLVVRSRPVALTTAGEAVLRLATQVALLEEETRRELAGERDGGDAARTPLAVAVNADSLATWFLPAVAPLADAIELRVHREDEGLTSELLRRGVVMAAVTAQADPVAGCEATALGAMRYRPMAAPAFAQRWFPTRARPRPPPARGGRRARGSGRRLPPRPGRHLRRRRPAPAALPASPDRRRPAAAVPSRPRLGRLPARDRARLRLGTGAGAAAGRAALAPTASSRSPPSTSTCRSTGSAGRCGRPR